MDISRSHAHGDSAPHPAGCVWAFLGAIAVPLPKQHNKSMQADSKAAFFDPAIINGQLELVMAFPNGNNIPNYAN